MKKKSIDRMTPGFSILKLRDFQFHVGSRPNAWLQNAIDLLKSAEILLLLNEKQLFPDEVLSPRNQHAVLLYGLAIENLIKGLALIHKPELAGDERLDKSLTVHDVEKLVRLLSPNIRKKLNQKLLKRIEQHILWVSKYPVPKDIKEYDRASLHPSNLDEIRSTADFLHAELAKLIKIIKPKNPKSYTF